MHPEPKHRCAQGPVFGRELEQGEAAEVAQLAVDGGRALLVRILRELALGLLRLLLCRLEPFNVQGDGLQHFLGVVAQDVLERHGRSVEKRPGGNLPLAKNGFEVGGEKGGEFHNTWSHLRLENLKKSFENVPCLSRKNRISCAGASLMCLIFCFPG
jgi:hypothetical protein